MAMHNRHENMPADAVLADDCPRCEEHARDPFKALDDSHLGRLVIMDRDYQITTIRPSTVNDWVAMTKIREVINMYQLAQNAAALYEFSQITRDETLEGYIRANGNQ